MEGLALVSAIWARYCNGVREDGSAIEPNDPFWGDLQGRAKTAESDPKAWLENRVVYGSLADDPRFADAFANWLKEIYQYGLEATLKGYIG